ncbi:MAG: hypothetical protein H6738_17435 [Alphaproteobacteria bacterium]|nr:hypothetical protein [Alphaproteobacteria bacterium]MCB9698567.1 hypothetical protein [Alphaproteobacteria bacterium]
MLGSPPRHELVTRLLRAPGWALWRAVRLADRDVVEEAPTPRVLQKPLAPEALARALRGVLDERGPPPAE